MDCLGHGRGLIERVDETGKTCCWLTPERYRSSVEIICNPAMSCLEITNDST